ncbi:lipoprotein 17-related variable surface protein [Malacoplasma penetrans]|uniref:lipoprotein 17-related variable surface protein n=1 Tax=Malacoplasma penetrans TaxID=28227 RepID=UPI001E44DCD3|nr:lipoprotein 17-related variable surface protein [Malacoplasma penetrans]
MNKLSKKLSLIITSSILSIAAGISVALPISQNLVKDSSITNINSISQATTESKVIPSEVNDQNANISTKNGPVTFMGNTITALDWYGNKMWDIDFSKQVPDKNGTVSGNSYDGAWPRAWYNWDYNRSDDTIWVLGFWSSNNKKQPLFEIKASDGTFTKHEVDYNKFSTDLPNPNVTSAYRFISALSSGKVMIYGGAGSTYDAKGILYDPKTKTAELIKGNSAEKSILPIGDNSFGENYRWYFFNLIPIANNKNLVEVFPFSSKATTDDTEAAKNASYDIYFLLVDDNLNMAYTTGTWSSKIKVADAMQGYRNTQATPQRDYYSLLDGRVVTVVYNTAIIIDAKNTNDIKYGVFPMSETKWIKSWAFDSNQNLYFKFKNESKIYKVSGTAWETLDNNLKNESISPQIYLDLSGVSDITKHANNLIIYNVYGYTGQLMMVNSIHNDYVNTKNSESITVESNPEEYGLAFGVTQNKTNQNEGDNVGILNGPNSILKASDFELSSFARTSKIPSEITKDDIETSNGFLKNSTDFKITKMDDEKGEIEIECQLYQIPWFTTTLPNDISPKTVTKSYTTSNKIADKTSWKNLTASTDYDFLNMKPSKITSEDLTNLDPFQVSFQSQVVVNATRATTLS